MVTAGRRRLPSPRPTAPPVADETLRRFVASPVAERIVETGGAMAEERRLITALFADISGFTALAQRVDTEQLLEIIDPVVARLSSIVGRYEGYVEKFAGDALLALFGAPVTHEDDAERALRVAIEMHEELARIREEIGGEASGLTLHVGVNSGHGIARILGSEARMDYAVLGDSVILAQRLESQTPSGETYVGATTVQLARGRFLFEPVGDLAVKGKAEPVPAWRLLGPASLPVEVTSPGTLEPRRATTLVGRGRELGALVGAIDREPGTGGLLSVSGEPGIGKSTLVAALATAASERGMRWLSTRCLSYGASLTYRPIAELVRLRAAILPDDSPVEAGAKLLSAFEADGAVEALPFVGRLLGLPDPPDSPAAALEPEAFRRALHEHIVGWLRSIAMSQPLVVLVEDVHWADGSSVELLTDLIRTVEGAPIFVCLTGRPEGAAAVGSLRDALADSGRHVGVELGPLDETGVGELVAELLGAEPPDALVGPLAERSGGNPFFAEEIVRALREDGSLARDGDDWMLRTGWDAADVPPTVEGVLAARIDRLPAATNHVLQVSAVIGRRVRDALLRGILPDEPALDERVAALVDSGLLDRAVEGGQPVCRSITRSSRTWHSGGCCGASGASSTGGSPRSPSRSTAPATTPSTCSPVTGGWPTSARRPSSTSSGPPIVLGACSPTARRSRGSSGRSRSRARTRPRTIARLRSSSIWPTSTSSSATTTRHWRSTGRLRKRAATCARGRGSASVLRKQGAYGEALATLDVAFAALHESDQDLRGLWLERAWTLAVASRFPEAIEAATLGLGTGASRDDSLAGHLLLQLTRAATVEGHLAEAAAHGEAAQAIFERDGDARGLASAMRLLGHAYGDAGRFDEAAAALRSGLEAAERVGNVEEIGGCLINLGLVEFERQAFEPAIDYTRRAIVEFDRIGHVSGRTIAYANLAEFLMRAGQDDEALQWGERAAAMARNAGIELTLGDVLLVLTQLRLRRNEPAAAAQHAKEAISVLERIDAGPLLSRARELARAASDQAATAGHA